MSDYPLTCSGPGPHEPADGILGTTTVDGATGRCEACPPEATPVEAAVDPVTVLAQVGSGLAAIPATATSTQMRSTLRTLGEQITAAIPT